MLLFTSKNGSSFSSFVLIKNNSKIAAMIAVALQGIK
jgi:pseudouridine-5'-phosphate glycosidase